MQLDSAEPWRANSKAFAYVRPHDLEVERYSPGQNVDPGPPAGIVVQLARAIVVGPIARLELIPRGTQAADNGGEDS
jgi:sulfate transport system ATP-binding protein